MNPKKFTKIPYIFLINKEIPAVQKSVQNNT